MEDVKPAPKRLIICCDGTWQSSVSGKRNIPSNVARLARAVAKVGVDDKGVTWQQIVYYDSGVGTGSLSWYEQVRQGGTGDGTVINILEAYNFLVNNYSEGDQIFCFGFSRGAFTARAIAGLVTDIGVFRPENMQLFVLLWALYQRNLEKRDFMKTKEYFQFIHGIRPMCEKGNEDKDYTPKPWEVPHGNSLTYENSNVVELVGVWDTVGSLGIADTKLHNNAFDRKRFEFLNVKLSPFIHHAFHAIALDEHREPFLPTLWYIPCKDPKKEAKDKELMDKEDDDWKELEIHRKQVDEMMEKHKENYPPDLHQVWFPGYHVNVGGGADENGADAEGLANIAFAWMIQMVGPFLAFPPQIWEETIPSYQHAIMTENQMYERMKNEMTFEQQKQYEGLIDKSTVESLEATAYDWGSWIVASGKKALGLAKKVEMVPVPADKIKPSEPETPVKWSIPEVEDSFTVMYNVMKSQYRSPGEMKDRSREGGELLKVLGDTHEYIHSSVWGRAQLLEKKSREMKFGQMESKQTDSKKMEYKPKALEGFVRQQDPTFQSWGYWKESTKTWIPEWFITPSHESLEKSDLPEAKGMVDKGKHAWQQVEWKATKNLSGTDSIKEDLVKIYIQATQAKKKMEAAGKEFPFDVPKW